MSLLNWQGGTIVEIEHVPTGIVRRFPPDSIWPNSVPLLGRQIHEARRQMMYEIEIELLEKGLYRYLIPKRQLKSARKKRRQ